MRFRGVAACTAAFSILCIAPALAIQGDPVPGADVSAEQSPSGIIMPAAKCKLPLGTLSQRADGKWICKLTPASIAALKTAPVKTMPAVTLKPLTTAKPLTAGPASTAGH